MAHFMAIVKVFTIKRKLDMYMKVKNMATEINENRSPEVSLAQRGYYLWSKYICCGWIGALIRSNANKPVIRQALLSYNKLFTSGTFANYIVTAIAGFLGGVIATYMYFVFVTVIFDLSLHTAFYISVCLCIFLTIGLAFIQTVRMLSNVPLCVFKYSTFSNVGDVEHWFDVLLWRRCITLSILPEVCTQKARNMILSYGLILLITGPGANILYNARQLTQTITCTREQLNAINRNLTELYLKPLRALRSGVSNLMNEIKPVIQKLKDAITDIRDTVVALADTVRRAFSWLQGIISLCNNKVGTPFELCYRMFESVIQDCMVKLFYPANELCHLGTIVQLNCYVLKVVDFFCQFIPFIHDSLFGFVQSKVKDVGRFLKTMFYVSISFHHSFAFETNESQAIHKIVTNVFHAEENRLHYFVQVLHLMKLILGAYILYILCSTLIYRHRFFRHLHYDNYHINEYFINVDIRRAAVNRPTVLPLTFMEKKNYVSLFSLRLTIRERINLLKDAFFLSAALVKFIFIFLIDISLHYILSLLSTHGRVNFYFGNDRAIVRAEGSGLWWTLYSFINNLLLPLNLEFRFDTQPCLPEPIPPAYHVYERVGYMMGFAAIMALFQPFSLRFRNYVMCNYYPEAARRRAVWLYNYILQGRSNIAMFVRRQIVDKLTFGRRDDSPNVRGYLLSRFPTLAYFLPYKDMLKECMVCGYTNPKVKCITPECPGTYCDDCFKLLDETCMVCNMHQDWRTLKVSEEEDSEEDDELVDADDGESRWKFWKTPSPQRERISLRNMENAGAPSDYFSDLVADLKRSKHDSHATRDYFDGSWHRDDWASLEDFAIPMPDLGSWVRPEYVVVENQPTAM